MKTQEGDFNLEGLWFYKCFKLRPKDRNPSNTNSKPSHVTPRNRECESLQLRSSEWQDIFLGFSPVFPAVSLDDRSGIGYP